MAGPLISFAAVSSTISNVQTYRVSNVTDTSANFAGSTSIVAGSDAYGYFRYSKVVIPPIFCNDIYGSSMVATKEEKISGSGMTFYSTAQNLLPNTEYAYCAVVSNNAKNPTEIKYGGVEHFTTAPCATCAQTTIKTNDATTIGETYANLNGFYNSTEPVKTYFQYRKVTPPTTANRSVDNLGGYIYGNWISTTIKSHTAGTSGNINNIISNLTPNTTYQFQAVADTGTIDSPNPIYGDVYAFLTSPSGSGGGGDHGTGVFYGNDNWGSSGTYGGSYGTSTPASNTTTTTTPLTIGAVATPPGDATVHYHEGIETVFTRQIIANKPLAKMFGYQDGTDLQSFAWTLSDFFAKVFGYVDGNGREIRVSEPDVAAYQINIVGNKLTVYEYYYSRIINVRNLTSTLKNADGYEYYFKK